MEAGRLNTSISRRHNLAVVLIIGYATVCCADVSLASPVEGEPVASNKGAAVIEDHRRATFSLDDAMDDMADIETADEAGLHLDNADAGAVDERRQTPGGRTIRRQTASNSLRHSVAPRPVAWYRSGIGAMCVVLAVVGGVYWAVRRWVPSARATDKGLLEVVARSSVSPKHQLLVVRIGKRLVVVGLSPEGINRVCDLDDSDELTGLLVNRARNSSADAFDDLLTKESSVFTGAAADKPRRKPKGGQRAIEEPLKPLGDLLNRLRELQSR